MEIKELTGKKSWPFRYTAPWISVLSSIFVLLEARKGERGRAQRAQNAMTGIPNPIACQKTKTISSASLFLVIHIALVAPSYVQSDQWESAGKLPNGRPLWMILDVCSMLFAGLGAIQGSSIVSSALWSMQFQNMVGDDSIPQVIRNMMGANNS